MHEYTTFYTAVFALLFSYCTTTVIVLFMNFTFVFCQGGEAFYACF